MAFKATILNKVGKSYKIEIKQGAESYIFYRSYNGTDNVTGDMAALENDFNTEAKKNARDKRKSERQASKNISDVEAKVKEIIASLAIKIPPSANATQNKLDNLAANLQNRIDNFIGSL